mgnify:FL=1
MKRAIFTFLAIVTFLSCAAQNPKAKVFNHGIKVLGSSTVTTVGASSRLVVVDADKNHVEITFDDLKTQLALAGGAAYTAGDGLELNVTEFKVDSTRIPRLHANSPVKTLEFSVGTIAANDAAGLPPEVIRYDTDGAAATDGYVDGIAFVKVGDVYTLTATRNGLADLTANFTVTGAGGAATWGSISGTIGDQTDLLTELNKMFRHNGSVSASGNFNMNSNNITAANYLHANIFGADTEIRVGTANNTNKGWGISADATSNEMYFGSSLDGSPISFTSRYLFSPTGALTDSRHVVNKSHLDAAIAGVSGGTPADNSVTNAKLADMPANRIKGRLGTTGDPQDLTVAEVQTLLSVPVFSSGTFTPTLTDDAGTAYTTSSVTAKYRVVEDMVFVDINIQGADFTGSPSGSLEIRGLPFTVVSTGGLILTYLDPSLISGSYTSFSVYPSGTTIDVQAFQNGVTGVGTTGLPAIDSNGSGQISIGGFYFK